MDKILEILGVNALNENDQEAIKQKLEILIESKAQEKVEEILESEKANLVTEYEEKFAEFTDQALSRFSDFVDTILEEEMEIPEKIVEYARKGELYEDVILDFKKRLALDEGILDEEVQETLAEARDEIVRLTEELNEAEDKNFEAVEVLKEARAKLYVNELLEGVDYKLKSKIKPLLEGIIDADEIDSKFEIIFEALKDTDEDEMDDDEEDEDKKAKKSKKDNDDDEEDEDMNEDIKGKGRIDTQLNEDKNNLWDRFITSQISQIKGF